MAFCVLIIVKCTVEDQEFTMCGTACPPTCEAPNPGLCTEQCVIGCQCPKGLILDEENDRCVMKKDCGMCTSNQTVRQYCLSRDQGSIDTCYPKVALKNYPRDILHDKTTFMK